MLNFLKTQCLLNLYIKYITITILCKDKNEKWSNCDNKKYLKEEELHNLVLEKINFLLNRFYDEKELNNLNEDMIEQDLFKDKIKTLEKELNNINKELQNKSSYFQRLYEDRTSGILPEKEFLILMNKYKDDTAKLEERMKIIKKDIATTATMKESLKSPNLLSFHVHLCCMYIRIP